MRSLIVLLIILSCMYACTKHRQLANERQRDSLRPQAPQPLLLHH